MNKRRLKFSIIVPVYNTGEYLKKCINSILDQDYANFELLLIDDGSTDQSGALCDEFAQLRSEIKVVHKNNGGVSDARNSGLGIATGEYIVFIDSDDYIELNTLEQFAAQLESSNHPDVMVTRMKKKQENSNTVTYMDAHLPFGSLSKYTEKEMTQLMFSKSNSLWPAVRYVVKRELIEQTKMKFAVGYVHEDLDWTFTLFLNANTYTCSACYWYNHRVGRIGSITTTKNHKKTVDLIHLVAHNIKEVNDKNVEQKLKNIMIQRLLKSLFFSLSHYAAYGEEGKRAVIEALKQNRNLLNYTSRVRHKLFVIGSKVFGFEISLYLLSTYRAAIKSRSSSKRYVRKQVQ